MSKAREFRNEFAVERGYSDWADLCGQCYYETFINDLMEEYAKEANQQEEVGCYCDHNKLTREDCASKSECDLLTKEKPQQQSVDITAGQEFFEAIVRTCDFTPLLDDMHELINALAKDNPQLNTLNQTGLRDAVEEMYEYMTEYPILPKISEKDWNYWIKKFAPFMNSKKH